MTAPMDASEVMRNIDALISRVHAATPDAAEAGGMVFVNGGKRRAPVKTGTLRRSIHHETKRVSETKVQTTVGTDVSYGAVVERRRPYMRPTLDEDKSEAKAAAVAIWRGALRT